MKMEKSVFPNKGWKSLWGLIMASCQIVLFTGCTKELPAPTRELSSKTTEFVFDEIILQGETVSNAKAAALPNPVITSITSVASCYNRPPSLNASNVVIPWIGQQNQLVLTGTNFGTAGKSIVITDLQGKPQSFYSFAFLSWKDTEIRLQAGAVPSAQPLSLRLSVTTSDNRNAKADFTAIPMISGKIHNSPGYHTNKTRIDLGLRPQPYQASYVSSGGLNDSYIPTKGDIWFFGGVNEGILTSVTSKVQLISQTVAGTIENVTYQCTHTEMANSQSISTVSHEIVYRRTTTFFKNAPNKVSMTLITPPASAFTSVVKGAGYAKTYYR